MSFHFDVCSSVFFWSTCLISALWGIWMRPYSGQVVEVCIIMGHLCRLTINIHVSDILGSLTAASSSSSSSDTFWICHSGHPWWHNVSSSIGEGRNSIYRDDVQSSAQTSNQPLRNNEISWTSIEENENQIFSSLFLQVQSTDDVVVAGWSAFWTGSHLFHSRHMVEIISYCIMNWKVFNKYQSGTCKKSYIPILCAFTSISSTEQCQQMWWKWEKLLSQKCRRYSYKNNTNIECPSTFHQTL